MLENGAKILASKFGNTPLHYAAFNNAAEFAKLLLAYGAEVNEANNDGWTPLRYAVNYGAGRYGAVRYSEPTELVQLLIDNGADVNARRPLCCMRRYGSMFGAELEERML